METYQVWFLRRDGDIVGSFPDAVIAQHMILGRVREGDEVSLDTHFWQKPDEVEALKHAIDNLIGLGSGANADDPEWRKERMQAAVRWLDERKAADRRSTEEAEVAAKWAALRGNKERRLNIEAPEILAYRRQRGVIEASFRRPRRNYKIATLTIAIIVFAIAIYAAFFSSPVKPYHIDVEALMSHM